MPKEPTYTIAPLVWKGKISKPYQEMTADIPFGQYSIFAFSEDRKTWKLTAGILLDVGRHLVELPDPETIEQGKAYAEAHYQKVMKRGLKEVE